MKIELGYNLSPSTSYFVSIALNDKEWLSFDNTIKGFRAMKQVLCDKKFDLPDKSSGEWDDIVLEDGKHVRMNHVVWYDFDKYDVINNETWYTVWVKPISDEDHKKLQSFSRFVADNLQTLNEHKKEMGDFEAMIGQLVEKYK